MELSNATMSHYNDGSKIIICSETPVTVIAHNTQYCLHPGDVLFIPPYMSFTQKGNTEVCCPEALPLLRYHSIESKKKLTAFLQYIDSHFEEEWTLETAAEHTGFSKYHFARLFKEYTGTTFSSYLTYKRVQSAKELLNTPLSITEIAFRTGFNSLTTFCRCFKKCTCLSPSDYRSQTIHFNL